jgi:CRISPR/Cas system-associated exonuclease Cas4 (RecB family)
MSLPSQFQFSQASLQDYSDCRRRFELRYLNRLPWPAIESEPVLENERYMQKGAAFHHLVRQHQIGLPVERLSAQIKDQELSGWWQRYLETVSEVTSLPGDSPVLFYPEQMLSAPLAGFTLLAKVDLLLAQPGERLRIVDWKTSRYRPKRSWLADRLQTRVYRFLAVEGASHLTGGIQPNPNQVEMVYWFTHTPQQLEIFGYSLEQHQADREFLTRTIEAIAAAGPGDFPLTPDEQRCRFCVYRSLCDRGVTAGELDQLSDSLEELQDLALDASLDFDQVAEIEF